MANEIIKPHKFEVAKNNIYSQSKTVPYVSLKNFPTEGSIFSWNDHNITGEEANRLLVSPLQNTLIAQKSAIRSLFSIAKEVYQALESLDKEYIQGIIAAVKSAEIASDQAKAASNKANTASNQALDASRKALDASTKATTAQADIKRTIEALQATVRILKEFKEKATTDLSSISTLETRIAYVNCKIQTIENNISDISDSAKEIKNIRPYFSNLTHITDIDQIWDDLKSSREVVKGIIDTLTPFMSSVNQATSRIDGDIDVLKQYRTHLESYQHLGDVDAIWSDVEGQKAKLASFQQQVDAFVEKVNQVTTRIDADIYALKQYRTHLESYQHLDDVDAIWSDVEGQKAKLASFQQQVDAFVEKVNQTTTRIDADIDALKQYRALLELYQHLGDIDAIWSDVEGQKTELASFHQQVDAFVEKVNQATTRIGADIYALKQYRTHLESYQHIGDIDAIWSDVEGQKTELASFHQQVDAFVEKVNQATTRIGADIYALKQYRARLETYQHLGDVDAIWSDVEGQKANLLDLHEKLDAFIKETHLEQERIKKMIHQMEENNNLLHLQYNKRFKIAYWVGGSAAGLIVINYILQIIGIL